MKLQKRAVRIVSLSKYNAHTEPILKNLNLLKVTDILKLQVLKFFYRYRHNMLPNYLQNMPFISNFYRHEHNTRHAQDIHRSLAKHEFAKKCIRFHLPHVINSTPNIILDKINTHSLQGFAYYIKKYMLQSYQEQCTLENCYICSRN